MITTARGYAPRRGGGRPSRRVTLGDFEGFCEAEDASGPDLRRRRYQAVLAYGVTNCLTPRQREVVDAYYYRGEKVETIARALGVSPSTVCRHLQAARRRLSGLAQEAEELRRLPT